MLSDSSDDEMSRIDSQALGYRSSINSKEEAEDNINNSKFTLPETEREKLFIRHNNTVSFKKEK